MDYNRLISRLSRRGLFRINPELNRVRGVLAALGNPQDSVPSIHIAGTNGKGSVAACLESVLRQSGARTGLYTSPHLKDVRERIQMDRHPIDIASFQRLARTIFTAERKTGLSLTYFEFLTVAAFLHFSREAADVAIIETGMGGRWDATNVLRQPALTIITSIGLDHVQWLGRTETAIAGEKAGIIKKGIPLISGARGPAAVVIAKAAHDADADIKQIDKDFYAEAGAVDWNCSSQVIRYSALHHAQRSYSLGLLGNHQIDNAALVLAGLDVLRHNSWKIKDADIQRGLARVSWAGRLYLHSEGSGPAFLFDGAHNPPALQRLLDSLETSPWQHTPNVFVVGVYRDKDVRGMLRLIQPHAAEIILCTLPGKRALPASQVAHLLKKGKIPIRIVRDPRKAFHQAIQSAASDGLVIVTGSLALVGHLLPADKTLLRRPESPPHRTDPSRPKADQYV